nr:MAG TPA: hypothetical protein [Caudoviricetes sp.]
MSCFSSGFSRRCSRRPNKKHFTRSEMAGLFFCLASDTVQGFYFALLQYSPTQAFAERFAV